MPISGEVRRLVVRFQENRAAYVSGPYNETQTRIEFVDFGHIAKTAHEKTTLQRQIAATDQQIDHLVYALYGLTEEEIRIVEEGTAQV
jgi:hypothetical protein